MKLVLSNNHLAGQFLYRSPNPVLKNDISKLCPRKIDGLTIFSKYSWPFLAIFCLVDSLNLHFGMSKKLLRTLPIISRKMTITNPTFLRERAWAFIIDVKITWAPRISQIVFRVRRARNARNTFTAKIYFLEKL